MRKKIIAIMLLTLALTGLSAFLMHTSIKGIYADEAGLPSYGKDVMYAESESYDEMAEVQVPAFKGRTVSARPSYRAGTDGSNSYSYNGSSALHTNDIVSSNTHPMVSASSYYGQGKRKADPSMSGSQLSMNYTWRDKPDKSASFSAGTVADRRESSMTQVSQPFSSNSAIPGPMRLIGDDELPPGEGAPVGGGFWILAVLAGAYAFLRKKSI